MDTVRNKKEAPVNNTMETTQEHTKRGVSLNPKTFTDELTPEEARIAYWEPFIVMPKDKAISEINRIEARIEVIRRTMAKGGQTLTEWQTLGKEWGNLIRRSGQVVFGSLPESWAGPDLTNAKKIYIGRN